MTTKAVIGLGYGDEGKGVVTDYLCSHDPGNTTVVRFSGGHQCGHKVVLRDKEHIFANFGSGTLRGCPTFWSKYCTFDPVGFMNEYNLLKSKGLQPHIRIHSGAMVVTPYDIFACQRGMEREHGTCGTGFYRTKKRNEDGVLFDFCDLVCFNSSSWYSAMEKIEQYHKCNMTFVGTNNFRQATQDIVNLLDQGLIQRSQEPTPNNHFVFEGNQGLMLDPYIGYMPHCTPSDCTPRNILAMGYNVDEVYLVTRCYQTRHGNGPMTNEHLSRPVLTRNQYETNTDNEFQGMFRTTELDANQLIYAKIAGIDRVVSPTTKVNLVVTCTDQMSSYSYTLGGAHHGYGDAGTFASALARLMRINGDVYVNNSPESKTIRRVIH